MFTRHLPPELLLAVFSAGLCPSDLVRVCCSCQHFRDLAEPILYGTVSLASTYQIRRFILALLALPSRAEITRSLMVDWTHNLTEGTYSHETSPLGFWKFHAIGAFSEASGTEAPLAGTTAIDKEAKSRGMSHGIRKAIQELVPSAHAVLLLDMPPNLKNLHVVPSVVEFWFWAAFPNACDPGVPKRLPQGLQSLVSLDVHYGPDYEDDGDDVTFLNGGIGFGHVKLATMLLLPNLRRLSFSGDDGSDGVWETHYAGDWNGYNSLLDLAPLKHRSGVTQLELRGVEISPHILRPILDMLGGPESVHIECEDEPDFTTFDPLLAQPTLRSFTFFEYPSESDPERQQGALPLATISTRDQLTHLALPVHALALDAEGDLARRIPRGVEHLDLAYSSAAGLRGDIDGLVKLAHSLAEPGRRVRRFTTRPALRDADSDRIRAACAASGIVFCEQPLIENPDNDIKPYQDPNDRGYIDIDDLEPAAVYPYHDYGHNFPYGEMYPDSDDYGDYDDDDYDGDDYDGDDYDDDDDDDEDVVEDAMDEDETDEEETDEDDG